MIMTDNHKMGGDKCHKVSDNWGLQCQEGSLTNNSHN